MNRHFPQPVIGLAGGIGSGKSEVARILEEQGCTVAYSDQAARLALNAPDIRDAIIKQWGKTVLDQSGDIDRSRLAELVFTNPTERKRLESLTHPWIERRRKELFASAPPDTPALVIDAPLLFEAGLDRECDAVIFVDSPLESRVERVRQARDWGREEIERREQWQWPLDVKRRRADYIVRNDGDLNSLVTDVQHVLKRILAYTKA